MDTVPRARPTLRSHQDHISRSHQDHLSRSHQDRIKIISQDRLKIISQDCTNTTSQDRIKIICYFTEIASSRSRSHQGRTWHLKIVSRSRTNIKIAIRPQDRIKCRIEFKNRENRQQEQNQQQHKSPPQQPQWRGANQTTKTKKNNHSNITTPNTIA